MKYVISSRFRLIVGATFILTLLCGPSIAGPPLRANLKIESEAPVPPREAFYRQDPDYSQIYNMSSGFDAEIADDIPDTLAGRNIGSITLWMGEWFYGGGPTWRDPVGIRVNLYLESCPPELDPALTWEVLWDDLDKDIVLNSSSVRLYEVRVHLPAPVEIAWDMSLGATALIDWGQEEPFTGICATPMYTSYGDCVAYLDAPNWGYTRWTAIDFYTTIAQDLAYQLDFWSTGVEDVPAAKLQLFAQPNPFNPKTTLRCVLDHPASASLAIFDTAGRKVATLLDAWTEAGQFQLDWDGRDDRGKVLGAGVYLALLESENRQSSVKLVLLK